MRYRFIDKYGYGKPFVYIHPYKQQTVKAIVDNVFPGVKQLIIFGSATSTACKPYSDVDVCVIGDFDTEEVTKLRTSEDNLDILHFKNIEILLQDTRLVRELKKKGVRVYG